MLFIDKFLCEDSDKNIVTDNPRPRFSFSLKSDRNGTKLSSAKLSIGDWNITTNDQIGIEYTGKALEPFTTYEAELEVIDDQGEKGVSRLTFETGRLDQSWEGRWITDGDYSFREKKVSPVPMVFRKDIAINKKVKSAKIYSTAMGMYTAYLNGKRVGKDHFAPGFTSYKTNLQYQVYDVTSMLTDGQNHVSVIVSGGWAVGSFVFSRVNRVTADRQALLMELRIEYANGTFEVIGTDNSWMVSLNGPVKEADIYDGEVYDATVKESGMTWRFASDEKLKVHPQISATYGSLVCEHERFKPVSVTQIGGDGSKSHKPKYIYDFGQNFAGIIELKIKNAVRGQKITVTHAEILKEDGTLNTDFLRSAKARIEFICEEGEQVYAPQFTYMGFRYACVEGIDAGDVEVTAIALYSDIETNGSFECSNKALNQLQSNIVWGAKSNFVEIPTDCPQRDERMGWTGDIAVFAPTAVYNFRLKRFLTKWLKDMRAEQKRTGGIPNTIPSQGFGFPATMPVMAVDFWGDASVLVPWALYQATGDIKVLEDNYDMMCKYVKACIRWAGLFSLGKNRYIWNTLSVLHFGDWVAPDVPQMSQWQGRSKWTATASLAHTSGLLSKISDLLGKENEKSYYEKISKATSEAYRSKLMDEQCHLKGEEFQTGYVLPISFDMLEGDDKKKAAKALADMVVKNKYCIGTGFPGTPYILFALADNGYVDEAYKMLLNDKCPSWLYEVKVGATTIWERWDGLDENGNCPIGDDGTDKMISYNHYASGAVGDFLYRRVLGIEPTEAGYKSFKVEPVVGDEINHAKGSVGTPYGDIAVSWEKTSDGYRMEIQVPVGTTATVYKPDGKKAVLESGTHVL
jgi:alpha-L-rhamnosidase